MTAIKSWNQKLRNVAGRLLIESVDLASLAAFRIFFGLLMAGAMIRFLAKGWVRELYVNPVLHFTYPGFAWVRPLPDALMHLHFILLALLALGVAFGFFYRACIILFFLGFTYVELLDQTAYLNHYYLISLLSGLLIFLPAHRLWSIDAWRKPGLRIDAVPAWSLNLLRFQIALVYLFAGLAKLNADWLFRAQPLRIWLAARSDLPWVGPWLDATWIAFAASWFGAAFDTSIVFFLLHKPTRRIAYAFVILFHVGTWILFHIGMFPWIMIVAATLLFSPDWPRAWITRLGAFLSRFKSAPLAGRFPVRAAAKSPSPVMCARLSPQLVVPLALYVAVQIALPLRPFFSSQPSAWTCSGFNCAWRVMIAEKTAHAEFYARESANGKAWKLALKPYLTPRQETMMAQDPYLIRDLARRLAADLSLRHPAGVQIRATVFATLNGRPSQLLIDPRVNLASPAPAGWILPLAGSSNAIK